MLVLALCVIARVFSLQPIRSKLNLIAIRLTRFFPRLPPVTYFPALAAVMFSRAFCGLFHFRFDFVVAVIDVSSCSPLIYGINVCFSGGGRDRALNQ